MSYLQELQKYFYYNDKFQKTDGTAFVYVDSKKDPEGFRKLVKDIEDKNKAYQDKNMELMNDQDDILSEDMLERIGKNAIKAENANAKYRKLTPEEKTKREQVRNLSMAKLAKAEADIETYDGIAAGYAKMYGNKGDVRVVNGILRLGCKSPEEYLHRMETAYNGTEEEKQKMLGDIVKYGINVIKNFDMFKISEDKDLVEQYGDSILDLQSLTEMDGNKINEVYHALGIEIPLDVEETVEPFTGMAFTFSKLSSRIEATASPYYPVFDTVNAPYIQEVANLHDDAFDAFNKDVEAATAYDSLNDTKVKHFNGVDYSRLNSDDFEHILAIQKMTGITYQLPGMPQETDLNYTHQLANRMMEGKSLAYDKDGNMLGRVTVDVNSAGILDFGNPGKIDGFDMENPKNTLETLAKMVKKLDVTFGSNHAEFENLKNYLNDAPAMLDASPEAKDTIFHTIRSLAGEYLESKYQDNTPKKTSLTFKREDFCDKLLHSIPVQEKAVVRDLEANPPKQQIEIPKEEIENGKADEKEKFEEIQPENEKQMELGNPEQ